MSAGFGETDPAGENRAFSERKVEYYPYRREKPPDTPYAGDCGQAGETVETDTRGKYKPGESGRMRMAKADENGERRTVGKDGAGITKKSVNLKR